MNPNASKNVKLVEQYPFIQTVLSTHMEPYNHGPFERSYNDLTIHVEKADGDLMFRRADNIGLGDSSLSFALKGKHKDQVARRGEHLFAIDGNGKIVNRVKWPRNDMERQATGEVYAWTVFWTGRTVFANGELGYKDPIHDKVKYLVWVTVESWYVDTKNDDAPGSRFGELKDRSIHLTIYTEPEQGFQKLQEGANVYSNLWLDSRLMTRGVIQKDYDMITMGGMLYEMCITFQDEVYLNGMKDVLDKSKFRGASGQFGSVKVLAAEMCGYDRVMLEDSVSWVTFQLRPGSAHLYVLGQQGTLPQIRNLVRTVVRLWREKPELRTAFQPDKNVSVV